MTKLKTIGAAVALVCVMCAAGAATASASTVTYTGNGKFSITSGVGKLLSVGGAEVNCQSDSGNGQLGPSPTKFALLTILFKTCKSAGKVCTTEGQAEGTILPNQLEATFIKTAAGGVVALLKPMTGTAFLSSTKCGAVSFEVIGSILGAVTPINKKTKTLTTTFEQTEGVQSPLEVEGKKNTLEASFNKGAFEQAGLTSTETLTLAEGEGELTP